MNINILDSQLKRVSVVDNYTSLMWCKRYYEVGALDLEIEASAENINLFRKGYYITRDDDDAIFRIEKIELSTNHEESNNSLLIGAYDCKKILSQRIVWGIINFKGTVENYIKKIIDDNFTSPTDTKRKMNLYMETIGLTETIEQQVSYDDICEKIIELCRTYFYGWKVQLTENGFKVSLYKGVNRSELQKENVRVIFSPDYDNLVSTKYENDMSEFKNVAFIGGEGEGQDRKTRVLGNDNSGINRYEIFVDAKSMSTNSGDLVDYFNSLINKGKETLAEHNQTMTFEGEVDTTQFKYKTDYNLGDVVTIRNEYGIGVDARIVEIVETWNEEGYTLEPIFEYNDSDVDGAILTENNFVLTTEDNNILSIE